APMGHVLPLQKVCRADEVGTHLDQELVLANAPERAGEFFKVPKIV
ncbi:MAG: aspartyl/glutamyl-tRNA amidotransferase subunit C, partial [Clostridia bacterium]|nr:aspartyl/glutamyl-tRNA amidotransferase subunit C [Clostridia bacterium]